MSYKPECEKCGTKNHDGLNPYCIGTESQEVQFYCDKCMKILKTLKVIRDALLTGSLGVCCDEVYDYTEELLKTIEDAIYTRK